MVTLRDPASVTNLLAKLLGWQKEVHIPSQYLVELIENFQLRRGVVSSVAHEATYHGIVLLLDKAVVVLA